MAQQPFYRLPDKRSTAAGVGLGLALARRWARELGGDLVVQPSSQGAQFALFIPA